MMKRCIARNTTLFHHMNTQNKSAIILPSLCLTAFIAIEEAVSTVAPSFMDYEFTFHVESSIPPTFEHCCPFLRLL